MIYFELFLQFVLISLIAFGGGQAALPLIERKSVSEMGWIPPGMFNTAVALGYITPGPVLITATFIGYQTAGLTGAFVATVGVFLLPWFFAALAANQIQRMAKSRWLKAFGKGAAPAVIGLLGVTVFSLGQSALTNIWYALLAVVAALLSAKTKIHPAILLLGGAIAGAIVGKL